MQPDEDEITDEIWELDQEPIPGLGMQPDTPADDEPDGEKL